MVISGIDWLRDIDKIFVVNLPRREDRRIEWRKQAADQNLIFEFWIATANEDGEHGLRQTMRQLFTHCIANNYDKVVVFEDDCVFLHSLGAYMDLIWLQVPEGFDLLYLGGSLLVQEKRYSDNLLHASTVYATHSVIYSRAAIEAILPLLDDSKPYDKILQAYIQSKGNSYFCYPMLTSQSVGKGDIYKPTKEELDANPVVRQYYNEEKGIINWDRFMMEAYERNTKHL